MKTITLNKTDLQVSEICLGADYYGSKQDKASAFAQLDRFREAGGNFVDTASIYARDFAAGYSRSERILGEYLASRGKNSLVIATKGAHPNPSTMKTPRMSVAEIGADLDESLASLGLDHIDFYWLHRDAPDMPIGEILEIMEGFVKQGKIRFYGGSNYTVARMREADAYAKAHGLRGFSGVSNMWSPAVENLPYSGDDTLVRYTDDDLSFFTETGMAFVPYHSTAKGWFAKRALGTANERLTSVFENDENLALLAKLQSRGGSVQTELLRYIREYPMQIVPITSVSRLEQLDDIAAL